MRCAPLNTGKQKRTIAKETGFPSVSVATKIAHFFGRQVEETTAGVMKDLARRGNTGK